MKYVWKHPRTGILHYRRVVKDDPPGLLAMMDCNGMWLRSFGTTDWKAVLIRFDRKHREFEETKLTCRLMLGNTASPNDPDRQRYVEFVADARSKHGGRLPARHVEDPQEAPDVWDEYRAYCVRRNFPDPGEYFESDDPHFIAKEILTTWEMMRIETEMRMATVPDQPVAIVVKPSKGRADSMTELRDAYVKDKPDLSPSYISTLDMLIKDFVATNGNIPIQQISDEHVVAYREVFAARPQAANTKNRYLRTIRGMLNWAIAQRYLAKNPFDHVGFDESGVLDREPFRIDEIQKLFQDSAFRKPGGKFGYGVYALFILSFLHGIRLREGAQLWTDDILEVAGIPTIRIDTTHPGQRVKNKSSRRLVPIHKQALKLLEFAQPKQPQRLFDMLPPGNRGDYASVSQRLNQIIRETGIANPRIVYHSTRHSMITQSRECGLDSEIRKGITGHAFTDVGEQYGSTSIKVKKREIDKLDYGFAFPQWNARPGRSKMKTTARRRG